MCDVNCIWNVFIYVISWESFNIALVNSIKSGHWHLSVKERHWSDVLNETEQSNRGTGKQFCGFNGVLEHTSCCDS